MANLQYPDGTFDVYDVYSSYQAPEIISNVSETQKTDAYKAYYDVLTETIAKYGMINAPEDDKSGVDSAQLIDFYNDGLSELLYTYTDEEGRSYLAVYGFPVLQKRQSCFIPIIPMA